MGAGPSGRPFRHHRMRPQENRLEFLKEMTVYVMVAEGETPVFTQMVR